MNIDRDVIQADWLRVIAVEHQALTETEVRIVAEHTHLACIRPNSGHC